VQQCERFIDNIAVRLSFGRFNYIVLLFHTRYLHARSLADACFQIIQFRFTAFRIQKYFNYYYVKLYDGSSENDRLIVSLKARSIDTSQMFYSSRQYMFVTYTSHIRAVFTGFNANYSTMIGRSRFNSSDKAIDNTSTF